MINPNQMKERKNLFNSDLVRWLFYDSVKFWCLPSFRLHTNQTFGSQIKWKFVFMNMLEKLYFLMSKFFGNQHDIDFLLRYYYVFKGRRESGILNFEILEKMIHQVLFTLKSCQSSHIFSRENQFRLHVTICWKYKFIIEKQNWNISAPV